MKQLGNLAIICAKREDTVLMIVNGIVHILVFDDEGYNIGNFRVNWDDDRMIQEISHELNFGQLVRGDSQ